ncbi:hypothetical protein Dform_02074 [Dehalogenimonas formicexedens]|uniref:Uncharacterized protein n=1 Tax=Dehalogenimonas formicexedens TaxID=1839801 RepID=A0A1P8FAA6_9CHLR|nr:hypothetical protein [Dehalogenimonas formicexedens]APV45383.1 hypothetical protein Dform_02074 [Dehalogenimonas formicexedens]
MPGDNDQGYSETRQERREKKRQAQKNRMTHHGKSIALIYRQSVEKRAGKKGK